MSSLGRVRYMSVLCQIEGDGEQDPVWNRCCHSWSFMKVESFSYDTPTGVPEMDSYQNCFLMRLSYLHLRNVSALAVCAVCAFLPSTDRVNTNLSANTNLKTFHRAHMILQVCICT